LDSPTDISLHCIEYALASAPSLFENKVDPTRSGT